ncbi:hypothetical protein SDJN02_24400, partial [Cucurbita argyrosperma subsp. argyrosperma]
MSPSSALLEPSVFACPRVFTGFFHIVNWATSDSHFQVNDAVSRGSCRRFHSGVCYTSVGFGNCASRNVNKKNWFQLGVLGANPGEAKLIHGTGMKLYTIQNTFIYFLSRSLELLSPVASIAEGCL